MLVTIVLIHIDKEYCHHWRKFDWTEPNWKDQDEV